MRKIYFIIISIILLGITSASLEIIKSNQERIIDIRPPTNTSTSSSITYINYSYSNLTQLLDVSISTPFADGLCVQTLGGVFVIGSCSASSGDITSVQGDIYITNGSNSGAVNLVFNETKINSTINNLIGLDIFHYNQTTPFTNWLATFVYNYNQTTPAITDINNRFWNRTQTYNITQIDSFNASWTSTYNSTYAGLINNASYLSTYNATYDAKISFNNTNLAYLNNTQTFTSNNTIKGILNISNPSGSSSTIFYNNGSGLIIQ